MRIHIDNDASKHGDEIVYRFTFYTVNEDPSTFLISGWNKTRISKVSYLLERSMNGGVSFETIVNGGIVPPPNIGPRSIESGIGLGKSYAQLFSEGIFQATTGEKFLPVR